MSGVHASVRRKAAWALVAVLAVVHYDFWYWGDRTLILGFLPVGLAYQVLISILASLVWWFVVRFAWPTEIEAWASAGEGDAGTHGNRE